MNVLFIGWNGSLKRPILRCNEKSNTRRKEFKCTYRRVMAIIPHVSIVSLAYNYFPIDRSEMYSRKRTPIHSLLILPLSLHPNQNCSLTNFNHVVSSNVPKRFEARSSFAILYDSYLALLFQLFYIYFY